MRTKVLAAGLALLCPTAAAATCPDPTAETGVYTLRAAEFTQPVGYTVRASGDTSLENCGYAYGFASRYASLMFIFPDVARQVQIETQGFTCDPILLGQVSTGDWFFDDDSAGNLQARLTLNINPANQVRIWAGTVNGDGTSCDGTLVVN